MKSAVIAKVAPIGLLALAGSMVIAAPVQAASAPSAPAITRAYGTWVTTLQQSHCDGRAVAALYTSPAILLATFKTYVQGRVAITHYFDEFSCKDSLRVSTQRITSASKGSMGYATGLYTFTYKNPDGTNAVVPARFTFVFENRNGTWLIANHHSSQEPQTAH
ncbi:MAG: DUF4440 domain-containing protein [Candidatus Nanopelagicales bacterium]